jgi:hypothetical protein
MALKYGLVVLPASTPSDSAKPEPLVASGLSSILPCRMVVRVSPNGVLSTRM